MRKHSSAASFVALLSLIAIGIWSVDAKAKAPLKGASIEAVRKAVAQDIGAQEDSLEIVQKGKILTITRVNSALNESTHQGRNDDATTIVAGVLKAIADKTEYKSLYSIYILYADRAVGSSKNKVIDTIEFRKNQKGEFEIHLT